MSRLSPRPEMCARQRGFTLIEMMVTVVLMVMVVGGMLSLLITQAKMSRGTFDRTDIQQGGRSALTIFEEKIGRAGLGLPRRLAIKSFEESNPDTNACANTPKLEVASIDFMRQWSVDTSSATTITLDSADPVPAGAADIEILQGQWVFLFANADTDGHGMVLVGAERPKTQASVTVNATNDYSTAQSSLDLTAASIGEGASDQYPIMLLADVAGFGLDCSSSARPFLYWDDNGTRVPIGTNIECDSSEADCDIGSEVGLRFRFWLDQVGGVNGGPDGIPDDADADGEPDFSNSITVGTDSEFVVAVEVRVVFRSDQKDPQLDEYRTVAFTRIIQIPNIHTESDQYIFIDNTGI